MCFEKDKCITREKTMKLQKYSSLRDSERPALERLLPLDFPLSIYIETTNRCNFRCRYCPMSLPAYSKIVGGFRTMKHNEFRKICKDIQTGGRVKALRFYFMGEPLLDPHLSERIAIACQMRLAERTELTTNGVLLDREKSQAIINSGLDYLRISISSVDSCRHKDITQTDIRVDHNYDNIKRFKQIRDGMGHQKPFLCVKMLDSYNDAENSRFLQMYQDVGDECIIEKSTNWDGYNNHDLLKATYGEKQTADPTELYPHLKSVCPFPFYTLMITVNGDVTVCCVDWNKGTKVGNAFESTLQSIWDGDEMRNFRRMQIFRKRKLNPSCRNCQILFSSPDNLDNMSESKIRAIVGPAKS